MNNLLLSILGILIAAVFIVAYLLEPVDATSSYWLTTVWIVILISANWFASAAVFTGSEKDKTGTPGSVMGSLPAINILIFIFSIISITLLIAYNNALMSSSIHLSLQVIVLAIFSVIILLTLISVKGAAHGTESIYTKRDLLDECRYLYNQNIGDDSVEPNELKVTLKETINHISFKMRHPSKINQNDLSDVVENLRKLSGDDARDLSELRDILGKIRRL